MAYLTDRLRMKSSTIRFLVIMALLACAGIIISQVYWLRRAFALQEQTFNLNVNAALRNVAANIWRDKDIQKPNYSPVEQINPDYFIVQTNVFVEQDVLQHYLISTFTQQNIITDFQYGLSNCANSDSMHYIGYYHMPGTPERNAGLKPFPHLQRENYYFDVYFPHRRQFLTSQLSVWTLFSLVLLCFIGFLGYLLFIIFKQKRLSEIQKDFVNNMTHEFKTPLSSIQLSADVLKDPGIINQPQRLLNYATIISNESAQLTAQVERVLQMAHAEKGQLQLKRTRFAWQDLLREEMSAVRRFTNDGKQHVHLEMPDEPVYFEGDFLHLKNTVSNLIDNAIKYCNQSPEITVILTVTKQEIRISVADNGIGIDPQHQRFLFDKFYRVPTGNIHNVKGFGLGLNYVRLIMRAHGGTINCESKLGKGSIFTLIFPHS
jgi:two-component system phosphate regulon sensor histidine kinase PhoR